MPGFFPRSRQLGWIGASFAIGIASWLIISVILRGYSKTTDSELYSGNSDLKDEIDTGIPKPSLAPEDVVRLQVNSIRDAVSDISKLKVCYSLASPQNRQMTGPFPRFAELVMLPPYDRLATCSDWQVGGTFEDRNLAAVLVSTVSKEGEVSGFRFILQRQDFPQPDCWLTEGVQFLDEEPIASVLDSHREVNRKLE